MAADPPKPVNMWRFDQAPLEFRQMFPQAGNSDWVAYVPRPERQTLEPLLVRWREVYPIMSRELQDQGVVYWGAPRRALELFRERNKATIGHELGENERRSAVRVQLVCPSRYETHTEPQQVGKGHTIDMSDAGIAFTTESALASSARTTLRMVWPVRLQGDVLVELRAVGRLARSEASKAAIQVESVSFEIADEPAGSDNPRRSAMHNF